MKRYVPPKVTNVWPYPTRLHMLLQHPTPRLHNFDLAVVELLLAEILGPVTRPKRYYVKPQVQAHWDNPEMLFGLIEFEEPDSSFRPTDLAVIELWLEQFLTAGAKPL